ncbi:MAG: phosphatase PAP2 family protein [Acidobacteria bacterium]|nr:phosphatase PAP2 family protein [Acidobacteriota bacterium]
MTLRTSVVLAAFVFTAVRGSSAQILPPAPLEMPDAPASGPAATTTISDAAESMTSQAITPAPRTPVTFGAPAPKQPFTSIGRDLRNFFSKDTGMIATVFVPMTVAAFTWDSAGIEESQEHLSRRMFEPGNVGGSFLVQTSASLATWLAGKATGHAKTTALGTDMVRAQILSQTVVQGIKLATRRPRPDDSNRHSFPSGHTASAFATASVLDRHLGKKVGIPAYAFASYVALARMSANKHHMSDVLMGAAMGLAAGRTATMHIAGARFAMGAAPTRGGAMVTFSKQPN